LRTQRSCVNRTRLTKERATSLAWPTGDDDADWDREVVQSNEGLWIQPQGGGKDVFVHISAVERAGLNTLNEGQAVQYEIVSNRGKESAENLKVK
jgi:CspA family cold shock protein